MTADSIIQVALPVPLRRSFDYRLPKNSAPPVIGCRVRVPFGNRQLVGILVGTGSTTSVPADQLKSAIALLDDESVLSAPILQLLRWCANYYLHPLGEVLAAALPSTLRQGKEEIRRLELIYHTTNQCPVDALDQLSRAPRQQEILAELINNPQGLSQQALTTLGLTGAPLKSLQQRGWIEALKQAPKPAKASQLLAQSPFSLNPAQSEALSAINRHQGYRCYLLEGVTGSGKTEVYLQAIQKCLIEGLSALVLVPEIGLTPQTLARFKQRFNVPITMLHSNLADLERSHDWMAAADGITRIIIGTRSAVFTPIPKLGIIIVDEEHDTAFKQQDSFRYHARDVAIMRAHQAGIPIILGSATPSLESLHNVEVGNYDHLRLPERAGTARSPRLQLLDIRSRPLDGGLSPPLIEAIDRQLKQQHQVLVFLNRRGFASTLMCHECGWLANCRRCDARMTLHRSSNRLCCHHCEAVMNIPEQCPQCQHKTLLALGTGTERTEESLARLFPETEIIRIDRDSTRQRQAMAQLIHTIQSEKPCILLGTQMLAKGHHFPRVTLAAVIDADSGFFSADFRGLERTAQLIIQVAGRAGRGEHAGEVIIQTHQSDHPALLTLIDQGYPALSRQLLRERYEARLPPYQFMAILRAEASQPGLPFDFLEECHQQAERLLQLYGLAVEIHGPLPAIMHKKAGRFRAFLSFQAGHRKHLHQLLAPMCQEIEQWKSARKVRWSLDIDPVESD